ncbi:MAG: hypothetical protein ACKVZJ_09705 [Phycisphaerales bacterium]
MELSSARELKLNLTMLARDAALNRAVVRSESIVTRRMAGAFAARSSATRRAPEERPAVSSGVAFGVAPRRGTTKRKKQYGLAVRVYGRGSALSETILARMPRLSGDEIDIARGVTYSPRLTLTAGGSVGHPKITAGTLGAFVEDADAYYMLSNNHVLANCNDCRKNDPIWQPGRVDVPRGRKPTVIGSLDRWIDLDTMRTDGVDAALATMTDEAEWFEPWLYKGVGEMDPRPVTDRYGVQTVVKKGRTTKITRGVVSAFELDGVQIDYGTTRSPMVVTFDNQMEFVHEDEQINFSDGGDSGSLILEDGSLRPVALLYGGGPDENGIDRTVAHHIPDVLSALGVQFVR